MQVRRGNEGLTFACALEDMAKIAKKGVLGILKLLLTLGEQSPRLFCKLLDSQIQLSEC